MLSRFSRVRLFATQWTVACQAPLSMGILQARILEWVAGSSSNIRHHAAAKSHQSYLTLCHPVDSSPPDSAVPGILQARTLEWVAIFFSNAGK